MNLQSFLDCHGGRGLLVHRHATYLMNPEGKGVPKDEIERGAWNYCRLWSDHANPLDQAGRDTSVAQGIALARAGIRLDRILVSRQGRGPETGLYVGIGYLNEAGRMPPIHHCPAADYPVYCYPRDTIEAFRQYGDQITAAWLNGKLRNDLCTETPAQFLQRVTAGLAQALVCVEPGGVVLMATHFEVVKVAHAIYCRGASLGTVDNWTPRKSEGVLLTFEADTVLGFAYDLQFGVHTPAVR